MKGTFGNATNAERGTRMSNLITDEMMEQIRVDVYGKDDCNDCHCEGSEWERMEIRSYLTAALPIIEKAVRDEQAKAIDTFAEVFRVDAKEHFGRIGASSETYLNALIDAARIVREGDHNDN